MISFLKYDTNLEIVILDFQRRRKFIIMMFIFKYIHNRKLFNLNIKYSVD